MSKNEIEEAVNYMRRDSAVKNKKGIAFIGASIAVWLGVLLIQLMDLPIEIRNLYSWFAISLLMPLALMLTKVFTRKFNTIMEYLQFIKTVVKMRTVY